MAADKIKLTASSTCRSQPKWTLAARQSAKGRSESAPGPGRYGCPPLQFKNDRVPSYSFGTGARPDGMAKKGVNTLWRIPGPGAYVPDNPHKYQSDPRWGFGSADRLPKRKIEVSPPPGTYVVATNLAGPGKSMLARRGVGGRSSSTPGPGTHTPAHLQTEYKEPKWGFGSDERKEDVSIKMASTLPGPGTYENLKDLGGNITTRSCPNYTFKSRRLPTRADSTPGPNFGHYTQFD